MERSVVMADHHSARGIDTTRPSHARVCDYLLGGRGWYAADAAVAEQYLRRWPYARTVVRHNRAFVGRAVHHLLDQDVRQFLDLGCGLPTEGSAAQIAQAASVRVVAVDIDPSVPPHGRALLNSGNVLCLDPADLRAVAGVLAAALEHLDFDRPVAVVCTAVLEFVPEDPAEVMRRYASAVAPGSWLALSHMTINGTDPQAVSEATSAWEGLLWPRGWSASRRGQTGSLSRGR